MAAIFGYLIATSLAVIVVCVAPGPRRTTKRDPSWDLDQIAGRLTILGFFPGALAFTVITLLPVLAAQRRFEAILGVRGHLIVTGYAQGVVVLLGFLLLAVLGLA